MQRPRPETVTLDDILITEELSRRSRSRSVSEGLSVSAGESPGSPNLLSENQALHTLAGQLVNQPEIMLESLVDMALELCSAGTAGVSLLEVLPSGEEIFRWNVLAGTLEQYVGGSTPRDFSPCGVCLERGVPVLFSHPERYFTYFQEAKTPVVEGLVLPLIADNRALGSIWIMSHCGQRHFDSEDVRVMTSLADFTAAALLLNQRQTQELLAKNAQLEAVVVERKRAEESARESEAYFRAIANLVPDMLWRNDSTGYATWYSQRWLDYTGQTLEEVQGYGWLEVIHPGDRPQSLANFQNAVDERRPLRQEHRIRGTDGNYRWFQVQADPVFDSDGRIIQWFGAAIDIHEQRTALEQVRESEERLRAMIENLPGGAAFVVDRNLRYLLAEGEALHAAGFQPEDLVGKTIFEVLPPELATYYEPMYHKALAGEPFEHEHSAHDRTYISRGTPLLDATGEVYAVLAISYDITARKQAEEALRESEEHFRAFVNASSDIVYKMSADWSVMHNLVGKQFIASTVNPKRNWLDEYIPEDEQPQVWAAIESAIQTKSNFELEHRVFREDGAIGWTFSRAIPLLDEGGEIVEWFGAASDVTERKQAEVPLRESEEKYRSLFESIDDAFCIIEMMFDEMGKPIDFLYLETNPAFVKHAGQPMEGKRIREIVPNFEQFWLDNYGRVAKTGEVVRLEHIVQGLGDQWFQTSAFRLGGEGSQRVAVFFRNITDRKRAEEQLRRAAQMDAFRVTLSDALRSLSDPVEIQSEAIRVLGERLQVDRVLCAEITADEETLVIADNYVNGVPKMIGRFPTSAFGQTSEKLRAGQKVIVSDAATDPDLAESDRAFFRELGARSMIGIPLIKGGRWVSNMGVNNLTARTWSEDDIALVEETAERTWAAVERARAEAALRESEIQRIQEQAAREEERQRAESLAELDRAKTLFFTNVSHEFRTPLTLLLAPLQDALSDRVNPLPPPHRERLELAHRNAMRLLKLVNTLLDFSRIEAGRNLGVYEATDLALLTTELASVFRSAIERAGLRLIVDCPPLPEPVYVDRQMWEKIVLNLLSNAFKFTLEGEIAVRMHPADNHYVRLQVQDTGTGIPPEELPHLFERFYQVRGAQARTHEGSGIGLALVHELIRLHGGTVDVTSTVGQGTCFTVTIPLGTAHLPNDRIEAARTLVSTALSAAPYVEEAERWLPEEEGGNEGGKEGRREGGKEGRKEGEKEENCLLLPHSLTPSLPHSPTPSLPHSLTPSLPHSSSPARVLLVDDNADMRDYLTRILSEHVQVQAVADGAQALAAATERVPDLILSDVMMPGLDGFELLKALRAEPCTREVPIILLSARAGEESVIEGLQAGADDYLIKPFSATELVTRVLAHLQMAHLRLEALRQERTTSKRKDEMLSTVSHELNTPLVAILGWTRLLRTSPVNQSMLMKSLETIERNATLQAKLISDLLDISRITADKLRLNLEPVELQSVIETAIATVNQTAQTKDIQLSSLLEPLPTIIQGDPERLQQIVLNLLTNAIKFTPKGGRIDIRLETTETQAQIKVSDTGCGIAAEFLPYVFDHFRQAENSSSTKGLGLGLAIALHLVELHGGTIQAESLGVGQGATFIIKFPLIDSNS